MEIKNDYAAPQSDGEKNRAVGGRRVMKQRINCSSATTETILPISQ